MAYKPYDEFMTGFWAWIEEDPEGMECARRHMFYIVGDSHEDYDVSDREDVSKVLSWFPSPELAAKYVRRCLDDGGGHHAVLADLLGSEVHQEIQDSDVYLRSGSMECLMRYLAAMGSRDSNGE